ncbi:hypothetical protein ABFT23_10500 [Nocardioides sp. C4-1]|uniref:hypothetical protein n=1 Tax=Nocardioides sp. C4-1 TaxID=3151851 RepID=UPI00326637E0
MARVQRIIDDLTGADLTEDVEPTTITVDGTDYTLDLGPDSKERLIKWLNGEGSITQRTSTPRPGTETRDPAPSGDNFRLTGDASEKFKADTDEYNKAKKEQRSDIQDWAKSSDKFADKVPGDRGGVKADLLSAYYEANPEQPQYHGANAVDAPKRDDYR